MDEKYKKRYFDEKLKIDIVEIDLGSFIKDKIMSNRWLIAICCLVIIVVGCFFPITFKIVVGILLFFASIVLATLGFMWAMKG